MKKAAIAIDSWKLSIFEKHLTQAGYTLKEIGGIGGVLILKVEVEDMIALEKVVRAASTEAAHANATR